MYLPNIFLRRLHRQPKSLHRELVRYYIGLSSCCRCSCRRSSHGFFVVFPHRLWKLFGCDRNRKGPVQWAEDYSKLYLILNLAVCDVIVGIPSELLLGLSHFYVSYNLYYVAYTSLYTSMVASALTIVTLAFERYIMVEAPLKSQEYLIHSHLRLVIVYIWLIALCVALLSILNRCNEAEYRLIITDAIGFPVMALMFLIYSRIFLLVRKWIRQDLDLSISESQRLLGSDNLSENIRTRERHIAFSVFCLLVFLPFAGHHVLLWKMYFTNIGDLPLWQLPQIGWGFRDCWVHCWIPWFTH